MPDGYEIHFVVLARFMEILSPNFVWRCKNNIINIRVHLLHNDRSLDKVEMRKMRFKIPVATLKDSVLLSATNPATG